MGGQPVRASAAFNFDRDMVWQRKRGGHGIEDQGNELVLFVNGEVEYQFVVNLKQHLRSIGLSPEQRVNADHRSHSRNQAPHSPTSLLGHMTVTEDVPRRNSMRISGVASTTLGLVATGSGSVLKVTGTNACD